MSFEMENQEAFARARARVVGADRLRAGIGTLGEKTLHAILKMWLEPDDSCHEIRIGSFYADILGPRGFLEIQTANFGKLRPKLEAFLPIAPVTIVYPVARTKWLMWIDETTGEVSNKRKSPKTGRPNEVFRELVRIKSYINDPRLSLLILLVDIEEYRLLNGWSKDRKKGSTRFDRLPSAIAEAVSIQLPEGLDALIPNGLPEEFKSRDFSEKGKLRMRDAQTAINVLLAAQRIRIVGKAGRSRLYIRVISPPFGGKPSLEP